MSVARGSEYRPDIDGLRAVAVLVVVAFHAFPRQVRGGYVGVDIFFVISGFLISGIILHSLKLNRFSYFDFYARRIRRIFPALIVVLAAVLLGSWFVFLPDAYKELGKQTLAAVGFASNLLAWSESGYFDENSAANPLLHLWSLGVEEQFYIAWPLVLAFVCNRSRHTVAVICCLLAASFAANIELTSVDSSAAFYLPVSRFWELLVGALLAYQAAAASGAAQSLEPRMTWATATIVEAGAWLGVVSIAVAVVTLDDTKAFPGWWALLPVLGALLLVAARRSWLNRMALSNRLLVGIGLISYPLYLWHWVLLTLARVAVAPEQLSPRKTWAIVGASFVLAWLTYILVEKPIRFGGGRLSNPAILLGAMALLGMIGLAVDLSDGGSFRYPPQIRPLAAFQYDRARKDSSILWRSRACFLEYDQGFADLKPECTDTADARPLLALWGDSHAASLYPGLRMQQQAVGGFRIAQFTKAGCPPFIDTEQKIFPACRAFNADVLERLISLKPDVVLLEGDWTFNIASRQYVDTEEVGRTLRRLQAAGVRRVVLFGCLPIWTIIQPEVGLKIWSASRSLASRTTLYLDSRAATTDAMLAEVATAAGAAFVSPLHLLCNESGCLLSSDGTVGSPVTWDRNHLTRAGSDLLVGQAIGQILGNHVVN
jgi:peptidoglycan/LPS O-acetylase OafA/YrhL